VRSAAPHNLDVAKQGIHPFERGVLRGRATAAGHDRHMPATCRLDGREVGQTVGKHNRAWHQAGTGIACDLALLKTGYTTQVQFHRPAVLRRLNGGDERGLVMCAAAAPAGHLTAEVGIVDLDPVAEGVLPTTLKHHLHQLVLHPPDGVVVDPEVARELQCRQALLALGEQKDGEEPLGQRQLRAMEEVAGGQRGLMMALMALAYLAAARDFSAQIRQAR